MTSQINESLVIILSCPELLGLLLDPSFIFSLILGVGGVGFGLSWVMNIGLIH